MFPLLLTIQKKLDKDGMFHISLPTTYFMIVMTFYDSVMLPLAEEKIYSQLIVIQYLLHSFLLERDRLGR